MKNTNKIYNNPVYQNYLKNLESIEKDRIFCKHDFNHFIDVARIMTIYCLEEGLEVKRDLIYTASILHDIGRYKQYTEGVDHDKASVEIAEKLLKLTDYDEFEKETIINAIRNHRHINEENTFEKLFYKADKTSRLCFRCPVRDKCNWSDEKKNLEITI